MNFSRRLVSAVLVVGVAAIVAVPVASHAQSAGVYSTSIDGSTNVSFLGLTTNTLTTGYVGTNNHSQVISEFDYVGFTVTLNGSTASAPAATSTATFRFVQSYDNGVTYETTPSISYTTPPINGITPVTFGTNFFCFGSHIKPFDVWNTNASAYFTNMTTKFYLKQPKRGANTQVN
jgi:hypothetical protein